MNILKSILTGVFLTFSFMANSQIMKFDLEFTYLFKNHNKANWNAGKYSSKDTHYIKEGETVKGSLFYKIHKNNLEGVNYWPYQYSLFKLVVSDNLYTFISNNAYSNGEPFTWQNTIKGFADSKDTYDEYGNHTSQTHNDFKFSFLSNPSQGPKGTFFSFQSESVSDLFSIDHGFYGINGYFVGAKGMFTSNGVKVTEPSTLALICFSLLGMATLRKKERKLKIQKS